MARSVGIRVLANERGISMAMEGGGGDYDILKTANAYVVVRGKKKDGGAATTID